jgi:hypothetical protein
MLDKYDGCTKIDWQFAEYPSNSIGAAPDATMSTTGHEDDGACIAVRKSAIEVPKLTASLPASDFDAGRRRENIRRMPRNYGAAVFSHGTRMSRKQTSGAIKQM